MNAPTIIADLKPKISVASLFHMMDRGVIDPAAKFELVEGEIVPMSPQGPLHQDIQNWLAKQLERQAGDRFWIAQGATLILPDDTALDPDICVYPVEVPAKDLAGDKVVLVVEVSVSSRSYDLGRKARLYAQMGVRELWVVDAASRETHIHRHPEGVEWLQIVRVAESEWLSPQGAPDVRLKLADAA